MRKTNAKFILEWKGGDGMMHAKAHRRMGQLSSLALAVAVGLIAGVALPAFKYSGENHVFNRTAECSWVEMDVPAVSVKVRGVSYGIEETAMCVKLEIVSSDVLNGAAAQWDGDGHVMRISKDDFKRFQIATNERLSKGARFYKLGWGPESVANGIAKTVRHEMIHAVVQQKYGDSFGDNSLCHFVHEMLAYQGGDGMTELEAAKTIMNAKKGGLTWRDCLYDDGVRNLAKEFVVQKKDMMNEAVNRNSLSNQMADKEESANDQVKVCDKPATEDSSGAVVPKKDSAVGIKGWCKCLEKRETSGAKSVTVGAGKDWIDKPGYIYRFCRRCGKCRRPPEKFSGVDDIEIYDREFQWKVQTAKDNDENFRLIRERLSSAGIKCGDGDTTHEAIAASAVAQIRLMQIPDGQIVIPGECTCATPDTIGDAFETTEVCINCGKYSKRHVIGPRATEIYQYEYDLSH